MPFSSASSSPSPFYSANLQDIPQQTVSDANSRFADNIVDGKINMFTRDYDLSPRALSYHHQLNEDNAILSKYLITPKTEPSQMSSDGAGEQVELSQLDPIDQGLIAIFDISFNKRVQEQDEAKLNETEKETSSKKTNKRKKASLENDLSYSKELSTRLLSAAEAGYEDACRYLLTKGADIDARRFLENEGGLSALQLAAKNGHIRVAKLLLEEEADINEQFEFSIDRGFHNDACLSPLHLAADNNRAKMVGFLLQNGANPISTTSIVEYTPLHLAAQKGHEQVVEIFLKDPRREEILKARITSELSGPASLEAAQLGRVGVLRLLLKADPNVIDDIGFMNLGLLHFAVEKEKDNLREVVELLLENGLDVNNMAGKQTPLHWAMTEWCYFDAVKILVENHADLTRERFFDKSTPLEVALQYCFSSESDNNWHNYIQAINLLLEKGPEVVNHKKIDDKTPLFSVIEEESDTNPAQIKERKLQVMRSLLEKGADPKIECTNEKITPWQKAQAMNDLDVIRLILEFYPDLDKASVLASK